MSLAAPMLWCGLALLAGAVGGWMSARPLPGLARLNLRFAAALFAAPSVAMMAVQPQLAMAALLMAAALASAALGLGVFAAVSRPVPPAFAAVSLVLALGLGLTSTVTGEGIYAQAPLMLAVAVMAALGFLEFRPFILAGAAMLLAGGLSLLDGGLDAASLFFAAALPALARGAAGSKPPVT